MVKAPEVEHLLEDIKRGDRHAFEILVRTLTQALFQYAGSIVRDPGAAEEIVQNTFIRVFKKRGGLDAAGSLRGYCYRIATNLARNQLRDRQLRREREQESVSMREQTATDPQNAALAREAWQMVEDLPDEMRAVMHLRYGQGLTLAETSVALEIPEGTVSTRQRSGLRKLRERLALSLPAVPALDELGDSLGSVQPVSVTASPGLVSRVEAIVMASAGTKSVSNVLILAIVGVLLLGGGAAVAAISMGSSDSPRPNTIALEPEEDGRRADDEGDPILPPIEKEPDGSEGEVVEETRQPDHHKEETGQPAGVTYQATIRGRVVDSAGNPVNGARVEPSGLTEYESAMNRVLVDGKPLPKPEGGCVTNARGEFELQLSGRNPVGADRAWFALVPKMEGKVGLRTPLMWVLPGGELGDITLTLYEPGAIEGVVVSAYDNRTPVSDVAVCITHTTRINEDSPGQLDGMPVASTDAQGRFRFEGLPPGLYSPRLYAETGKAQLTPFTTSSSVSLDEGNTGSSVVLRWAGEVLSFRTEPVLESVYLQLDINVKTDSFSATSTDSQFVTPDADGVFRVHGIYPGVKRVTLQPDGFVDITRELQVSHGEDIDLGTIRLQRGQQITGSVVDADGNPVPGAAVVFEARTGFSFSHTSTGENGEFRYGGLEPGAYDVKASLEGFGSGATDMEVPVTGTADSVRITLEPGGGIRGHVTIGGREPTAVELGATGRESVKLRSVPINADGKPIPGSSSAAIAAGPGGEFELVELPPGRYLVEATYKGMSGYSEPVDVQRGQEATATVNVPLGGYVKGRIVGRDGQPAKDLKVYIVADASDTLWKWSAPNTRTDADGRYRFEFVNPGTYYLRLESDPELMGTGQLAARALTVTDGETTEFSLDLSSVEGPLVRGRATVNGEALFKDVVLVEPDAAMSFRTGSIDDDGNFEVAGMKPGEYYLWFADSKWSPKVFVRRTVEVGEGEIVEFTRDFRGCSLSGRVVVANPPEDFDYSKVKVQIKSNAMDDIGADSVKNLAGFKTTCDEHGNYSWTPLVEGPYRIVVNAPGYPAAERVVDLSRDAVLDLVVGGHAGSIELSIDAIDGSDTAGALPNSSPLDDMVLMRVLNEQGDEIALETNQQLFDLDVGERVEIGSLLPGRYDVHLSGAHIEPVSYSVDVRRDEATPLKITLTRAAELLVRVLNDEPTPVEVQGARVEVYDSSGERVPTGNDVTGALATDSDAAVNKILRVNPLTAGAYRIVIKLEGYADHELEVQLERSRILEREVTLTR